MQFRLRHAAPILAVVALGGCASSPHAQSTPLTLTGRVATVSEVIGMIGDVAVEWEGYAVLTEAPGPSVFIVNANSDCAPMAGGSELYRFTLQRNPRAVFAFADGGDRSTSDLFVLACERLPTGERPRSAVPQTL